MTKALGAAVVAVVAWAIRVEMTLARHDSTLETMTKTLSHIEKIIEEWAIVKEQRAERMIRLETKLDFLIAARQGSAGRKNESDAD